MQTFSLSYMVVLPTVSTGCPQPTSLLSAKTLHKTRLMSSSVDPNRKLITLLGTAARAPPHSVGCHKNMPYFASPCPHNLQRHRDQTQEGQESDRIQRRRQQRTTNQRRIKIQPLQTHGQQRP
jgi:hypothetical protein